MSKHSGGYLLFWSIAASDYLYYFPPEVYIRQYGEHIQNLIWCVNIGEHMFFGSMVGSD